LPAQTNHELCLTWPNKCLKRDLLRAFHQAVRFGLTASSLNLVAHKVRRAVAGVDTWSVRRAVTSRLEAVL
jgi:hypothetical protein